MVGVGVEPPAPPAGAATTAARLEARGVRPRRVSAKRSWPPGCGRFAPPPPPPVPAAGDAEMTVDGGVSSGGLDGRVDGAVTPATAFPVAENGSVPNPGPDKVEAASVVLPAGQNGGHTQQGQKEIEEVHAPSAVSPAALMSAHEHSLPHLGLERAVEEGDRGETGKAPSLDDTDILSFDDQDSNRAVESVAATVGVPESCGIVDAGGSAQNDGERASVLVVQDAGGASTEGNGVVQEAVAAVAVPERCSIVDAGGSAQDAGKRASFLVVRDAGDGGDEVVGGEVADDVHGRDKGDKPGGGELERKDDGVGYRAKRWLTSAVNLPPKRRAVSAVRRFPPGCGRSAVTTKGNGVLEVLPAHTFPPVCVSAADTTKGSIALEVSPIRSFPPGCGRTVTTTGSGDNEQPPLQATLATNCAESTTIPISGGFTSLVSALQASNKIVEGKRMVDEGSVRAHNRTQKSQVVGDVSHDFISTLGCNRQQNIAAEASPRNRFDEKMKGALMPGEGEEQVSCAAVGGKMKTKLERGMEKGTRRTPLSDPIDSKAKGKRLETSKTIVTLLDNAEVSKEGKMQNKTSSIGKEVLRPNVNMKRDKFASKLKGDEIGKDNQHRFARKSKFQKLGAANQINENDGTDLVPDQVIVQALMAPDRCPWTQGSKSIASASKSVPPRNKLKGRSITPTKHPSTSRRVDSCELINNETVEAIEDSYTEDDDNSRSLAVYNENRREKQEICLTIPPTTPSGSNHGLDARSKVRRLVQLFQAICRKLMQGEEQGLLRIGRIDNEAMNIIKKKPIFTKPGPIVGNIPGVEVGDEFHFRVELALVGLHRPYQGGIDSTKLHGVRVAISIVASGGYPDELSSSDELIYTGSGGKPAGKKEAEDQKLERGNLALKNCIDTKTPVRVIHGFKGQSRSESSQSRGKQISTYTYDGLYTVVDCWQEGPKGSMVFKYKLQRIPGQPELALHAVKATRKSKVREGLCLPDISAGGERIPICVINDFDKMMPAPFKYITKVVYPPSNEQQPPTGCNCTNGCSDSIKCACAVKNGGEIPFNLNSSIVEAKPLVYECGPSCRCPPTCHNRVSQHGIKIPLEVFKTGNRGWGVRSLSSIPSGSFVCEYAGELLEDKEAEKRENDEYLFDIGSNYHDQELWEGLNSAIPGLQSSTPSSKTMEGFTIDAAECGNVGRFLNHSCSPNLYAQNVLWDHDDTRMPHVMFFALENIPPLKELTYHYNYKVGGVLDENGKEKVKYCYCGSSECCGRLY